MKVNKYELALNQSKWIDLVHPEKNDLLELASQLRVPERILVNALNPEHLPKYETFE